MLKTAFLIWVTGSYATGVPDAFAAMGHAAYWGRQAFQDKSLISGWVEEYQPDYILCLLGFNDMGWFVSDAEGTLESVQTIVDDARAAKSDVKILVGNVVQRLFISGRDDLVANTNSYNDLLEATVPFWNVDGPTAYVDVEGNYDCSPEVCNDGYDGLHPTATGEFHIAQAFANVLRDQYSIWGKDFAIPDDVPARTIITPSEFENIGVLIGLESTWEAVENARGYDLRIGLDGVDTWWSDGRVTPFTNRAYFSWCTGGKPLSKDKHRSFHFAKL